METIVTITYDRHRYQLYLQAHSLEKYLTDPIQHIVILESTSLSRNEWLNDLSKIYKKHKLVLIDNTSHPFIFPKGEFIGWERQQLLKLFVSKIIDTSKYVLFDSKNLLIDYRSSADFLEFEPSMPYYDWNEKTPDMRRWKPFADIVHEKTKVPMIDSCRDPFTPYIMDTETVKKLIATVDVEDLFVEAKLQNCKLPSEFILYDLFYNFFGKKEPFKENKYFNTYRGVIKNDCSRFLAQRFNNQYYLEKIHLDFLHYKLVNKFNLDEYYVNLALYKTNPFNGSDKLRGNTNTTLENFTDSPYLLVARKSAR